MVDRSQGGSAGFRVQVVQLKAEVVGVWCKAMWRNLVAVGSPELRLDSDLGFSEEARVGLLCQGDARSVQSTGRQGRCFALKLRAP